MASETQYQHKLIKKIQKLLPGAFVLKNDPTDLQGLPDLLVLYESRWAMLEVKTGPRAHIQPNQEYYVERLNEMSFAAFIYPANEEDVLNALQQSLRAPR